MKKEQALQNLQGLLDHCIQKGGILNGFGMAAAMQESIQVLSELVKQYPDAKKPEPAKEPIKTRGGK